MGILDDVPLPQGKHLLLASAGLSTAAGGMSLLQPKKTHEYYFEEEVPGDDDKKEPAPQHKPTTRWLDAALCWNAGLNVAAAFAPEGSEAKKNLLIANGAGLLAVSAMDGAMLYKETQKKKATLPEITATSALGVLHIARAVKGADKDE